MLKITEVITRTLLPIVLLGTIAIAFTAMAGAPPDVIPLGDLEGGATISIATSITADGSTVVGTSVSANGAEAFRWTAQNGMQGLGDLPGGGFGSEGVDVSADGNVVVGFGVSKGTIRLSKKEAFRWTEAEGMIGLGDLGGGSCDSGSPHSEANAVSADGNTVVGTACMTKTSLNGPSYSRYAAFRWTKESGMQPLPDFYDGASWSRGLYCSSDAKYVTGFSEPNSRNRKTPVLWGPDGVRSLMPRDPSIRLSMNGITCAISPGGDAVAGLAYGRSSASLYLWTALDGMRMLEASLVFPYAVSSGGRHIVGEKTTQSGDEAVIWDAANGVRSIEDVIKASGASLSGWKLTTARDVTPDGKIIVGSGTNPNGETEAWMVRFGDEP